MEGAWLPSVAIYVSGFDAARASRQGELADLWWLRTADPGCRGLEHASQRDTLENRYVYVCMPILRLLPCRYRKALESRPKRAGSMPLVRDPPEGGVSVSPVSVPQRMDASQLSILWKRAARICPAFRRGLRYVHTGMRQVRITVHQSLCLLNHRGGAHRPESRGGGWARADR